MLPSPLERIASIQRAAGDIINRIEILPVDNPNYIKLKVTFSNEDILHIRESWLGENLERYAYYWLDSKNNLKIGWDNVPHHPKIKTHPHHKHLKEQSNIQASNEKNLDAVLKIIRKSLA